MFWIAKDSRTFVGLPSPSRFQSPGNRASTVEQYARKSAFCRPSRATSVRSYALLTWPGLS